MPAHLTHPQGHPATLSPEESTDLALPDRTAGVIDVHGVHGVPDPWMLLELGLRKLLVCGLPALDTWKFMDGILHNQSLPSGLRISFTDRRVLEALSAEVPSKSPFWILFGWDIKQGTWGSSTPTYDFSDMAGVEKFQADTGKLRDAAKQALRTSSGWCSEGVQAMKAIFNCLELLVAKTQGRPSPSFPCFPIVMWGFMLGKRCTAYPVTSPTGAKMNWAIPQVTTTDGFFDVARDFLKAVWHLFMVMGFIDKPEVEAPPLEGALTRMPKNPLAANFRHFERFVGEVWNIFNAKMLRREDVGIQLEWYSECSAPCRVLTYRVELVLDIVFVMQWGITFLSQLLVHFSVQF